MALQIHHDSSKPSSRSRQGSMLAVPSNATSHEPASSFEGFLVAQLAEFQDRVASRARDLDSEMQLLRSSLKQALEAAGPEVAATIAAAAKSGHAQKDTSSKAERLTARDLPDYHALLPTDPSLTDSGRAPTPSKSQSTSSTKSLNSLWQSEKKVKDDQIAMIKPQPPKPLEAPQPPSHSPSKLDTNESSWAQDVTLPSETEHEGTCRNGSTSSRKQSQTGDSDGAHSSENGHNGRKSQGKPSSALRNRQVRPTLGGLEVSSPTTGEDSEDSETYDCNTGKKVSAAAENRVVIRSSFESEDTQFGMCDSAKSEQETFAVLALWERRKTAHGGFGRGMTAANLGATVDDERLFAGDHGDTTAPRLRRSKKGGETKEFEETHKPFSQRFIIEPQSPVRFSWDILGLFLITIDAAVIPLQFFNPPRVMTIIVHEWIARMFWTIDMPLSCITGFISQDGAIEMVLSKICYRYVTSWFCLDVIVVSFDWIEVIVGSTSGSGMGAARAVKAVKFIRMLRLMRLMRLMKMPTMLHFVMGEVAQHFRSEKLFFVGKIGKVLFLIIGFVHVVGCFWYAIGEAKMTGWVVYYDFDGESLAFRYMTSFHWSLANFAGGMDVEPRWVGERTFAVFVLLVAWMISATALSFITTAMTRDSFSKIQQSMQTVRLRRYLQEHGVNRKLQERLMKNAKYAINQKSKNMNEEDVELLQLVSVPLLIELHFEVNAPILRQHPFFDNYADLFPAAIRRICHSAISQHSFSNGDVLFTEGEKPSNPTMYFTLQGELKYLQGSVRPKWLHSGMWACEPVIWSEWVHAGYLCSMSECTLLGLSTAKFYSIAQNFDFEKVEEYASLFVKELNNNGREALSDLPNAALNPDELADYVFHGRELVEEHWARPCRESKRDPTWGDGKPELLLNGESPARASGFGELMTKKLSTLSASSRGSAASMSELISRISGRVTGWTGTSVRQVQ